MANDFDLIVIGSGSAARGIVYPCRKAGWRVAIAECGLLGGTCALRGCDPKKVLVGATEAIDQHARLYGKGVTGEAAIDWPRLMAFKRTFTDPFPAHLGTSLAGAGIEILHGTAAFTGPETVTVGGRNFSAANFAIAAGAAPAPLGIPGQNLAITSAEFLELDHLPPHIAFIGGGYIAFEFAHIAARTGSRVSILHRGRRPLEGFDPDLVEQLCRRTRELGVDLRLSTAVTEISRDRGEYRIGISGTDAANYPTADLVVHAAGRVPILDALHLESAGVQHTPQGVVVNEFLQSPSNPRVWAAGDAAASGAPRLTPVASLQAAIVVHNLLQDQKRRFDAIPIPSVVFTTPPLAAVGLSEQQARDAGLPFTGGLVDTSTWYSSRRVGETCSGAKVLVHSQTGRILGAHLLGPGAEETINLFALAMRFDIPASELGQMPFTYPTHSSDIAYLV